MRIRTIKPEFFKHDGLAELPPLSRLFFIGLWCVADRDGRLEDRPARLKIEILPYDKGDADEILSELAKRGFIQRYTADGLQVIQVVAFKRHQRISGKESEIPSRFPEYNGEATVKHPGSNCEAPGSPGREGKGKEWKGMEGAGAPRFQKPTLDALKLAMAKAGGTDTDAEAFLNHYEANGWKVGRNPMKSWPHAVGNWIARKREMSPGAGGTTGTGQKLNGGHARPLYVGELKAVLEAQRGKRAEIERRGYEDAFGIQFSKPEDRAEWQGISREIRDTLDKIAKAGQ